MGKQRSNRYGDLLLGVFNSHYGGDGESFTFQRTELELFATKLDIALPKNLGDLIYTYRYRQPLPKDILETASEGYEWVIELAGRGVYRFRLARVNRIAPSDNYYITKVPDATPEIVTMYAMNDEQALLAKVRYNRLIDIFLGIAAYSIQNHLRTTVPDMGQIETDEIYVGVRNTGEQFVVPVQAKGGNDQIGSVQILQDLAMCQDRFPMLTCRPVAVQFTKDSEDRQVIVMFELCEDGEDIRVVDEKQYRLVSQGEISSEDLVRMASFSG